MKTILIIMVLWTIGVHSIFAQQYPNPEYNSIDAGLNPAFTGIPGTNPDFFGNYSNFQGGSARYSEYNFSTKYTTDLIKIIDSNYHFYIYQIDSLYFSNNAPLPGYYQSPKENRYFSCIGYIFKAMQQNAASGSTRLSYQNYLSLSYFSRMKNLENAVGIGIQPGLVTLAGEKNRFDFNAAFALFGRPGKVRERFEGDCEVLKDMMQNYISLAIYNAASPYNPKSNTDTVGIMPHRRIQFSTQETFFAIHPFHLVADGLLTYNGQTNWMAGPAIAFDVHHKYYDMVHLGTQYQSGGHIVYNGGIRFFGARLHSLAMILNVSYDNALKNAVRPGNGWSVSVSVLPIMECWQIIYCRKNEQKRLKYASI